MENAAGDIPGAFGTGGMLSKIKAARKMMSAGVPMIIASGTQKNILTDLFDGRPLGTFFHPKERRLSSKKRWLAFSVKPQGSLVIDDGAAQALSAKGKSLLPGGIKSIKGSFGMGSPVEIKTTTGKKLGVGLVNYTSTDIAKIMGSKSSQIKIALGHKHYDEVIHRNNLVLS